MTETPVFTAVATAEGNGVTYVCGCPCTPTARPGVDGSAGFEHCCCGKVHFAGNGAAAAMSVYLADRRTGGPADRRTRRKREPKYETGSATVLPDGNDVEVAWAFPVGD